MNPPPFGKYQLIKKLATGGMAEVWLARQVGIEGFVKNVVVKRILPHLAEDREFVDMFGNEARIAARFNHPNIAQVYEFGEANGTYFIAMEFIHGEDLGRVMRKAHDAGGWIALPQALRIVASACEGLYYAHTRTDDAGRPLKVVHRDISPQNILISFDGSVKLVDFGIAKAADQATATKSGAIKGKLVYMAPEQAAGKPLDHRADIFAIGLVLYELLTNTRPLKRETEVGTLQAAVECNILPPSRVADVPPELDPVVMKALARAADDRYRDARQLQLALEKFLVDQQWVAGSVQLSELMETLFADRLERERRSGNPEPRGEDSISARAPPLSNTSASASDMRWESPPGEMPQQRRTETRTSLDKRTGSSTPPRGEMVGSTPVARIPGRAEQTRGTSTEAPAARRSESMAPRRSGTQGGAEPAPKRRTSSRTEMPEAPAPRRRTSFEQRADDEDASTPGSKPDARPASVHGRSLPPVKNLLGVLVALSVVGLAIIFRQPLLDMLDSSAMDGQGIYLDVKSNHRVQVSVRHNLQCRGSEPITVLGYTPLERMGGAHVRDMLILENKEQGIHEEIEVPFGEPQETKSIERVFQTGYFRPRLVPRNVSGIEIYRDGQKLGLYQPGLKLELMEGTHHLVLQGASLKEPVRVDVEVKAGGITDKTVDLASYLQEQ